MKKTPRANAHPRSKKVKIKAKASKARPRPPVSQERIDEAIADLAVGDLYREAYLEAQRDFGPF